MKKNSKKWSLAELASYVQGRVEGDQNFEISSLATLDTANKEQISFYHNSKYQEALLNTQAGAVLISEKDIADKACHPERSPSLREGTPAGGCRPKEGINYIIVPSAYLAFAQLTKLFSEDETTISAFVHPTAIIAADVQIPASAYIAAYVVIEDGVQLDEHVYIGAHSVIGKNTIIGAQTKVYPNVTLYDGVRIGKRCIIHSGAVIGSDGFGFARGATDWCKIYHSGSVVVGDDVEIGASTTIDRSVLAGKDTIIGDGVKLDNQIQIGHNVQIGNHTVMAGCSAVAGSTKVGANCVIGGKVGISGHITIADGTVITGMTAVTKSLSEKAVYSSGLTVKKTNQWKEDIVRMRRVDQLWNWMKQKVGGEA